MISYSTLRPSAALRQNLPGPGLKNATFPLGCETAPGGLTP